jgi:hypothetical protein
MVKSAGKKALRTVGLLFAALIGWFAVSALGGVGPATLIVITWFILAKCKVESVAVPMLAFVIGHTAWMIVSHAILFSIGRLPNDYLLLLVDVGLVAAVSIWFLWARSRMAAIGVLAYQILALGGSIMEWGEQTTPGVSSQAQMAGQAMGIFLRAVGICLCIYAIAKLRKERDAELSEVF